jgi:hypothetical protein
MRYLFVALLLVTAFAFAGCTSGPGGSSDKTSLLEIRNALTNAVLASGDTRGAITMDDGDTRDLIIRRIVTDDGGLQQTTDVTATADYNFTETTVAHADASGTIFADAPGFTVLTVKFHEDGFTEDVVELDITVL